MNSGDHLAHHFFGPEGKHEQKEKAAPGVEKKIIYGKPKGKDLMASTDKWLKESYTSTNREGAWERKATNLQSQYWEGDEEVSMKETGGMGSTMGQTADWRNVHTNQKRANTG